MFSTDIKLVFPSKAAKAVQTFDDFGILHSVNDEPAQSLQRGNVRWCFHGLLHRDDDKPAAILLDGSTTTHIYAKMGLIYRQDYIDNETCRTSSTIESVQDKLSDVVTSYYMDTGEIKEIKYVYKKVISRVGENSLFNAEPTRICYYRGGAIKSESWFTDGKLSRYDGPAKIEYNKDGSIKKETYAVMSRLSIYNDNNLEQLIKLKALGL